MAKPGEITADASATQAKKNAAYFKKLLKGMHMGGGMTSVRQADYKGHRIVVKTTYQVTIDGRPFKGELSVTNAGSVHYHGMPNVSFASAVDLIKCAIDVFPDEFAKGSHGRMRMDGMNKKVSGSRKKVARKSASRK